MFEIGDRVRVKDNYPAVDWLAGVVVHEDDIAFRGSVGTVVERGSARDSTEVLLYRVLIDGETEEDTLFPEELEAGQVNNAR